MATPWDGILGAAGSVIGSIFGKSEADQNVKMQKQFAQQGIQWKVADAKKAGIHPLYALGAQTHSFAPVQTGISENLASAGQSLGRAVDAYRSNSERLDGFTKASQALLLEKGQLENQLLKQQIASHQATLNQPGTPPPAPSARSRYLMDGQGSTAMGRVDMQPLRVTSVDPSAKHNEAGSVGEVGWATTATGMAPTQSADFKQRSEEDPLAVIGHYIRNRLVPMIDTHNLTPPVKPRAGFYWRWNPYVQEYQETPLPRKAATPMGWMDNTWFSGRR